MATAPDITWRMYMLPGSFRGAKFLWEKADAEVGRKTARHDYPGRNECLIEDLGKAPQEFTLECYVIGPEYMADRDDLIAALQTPGVGQLIHPTMGFLQVYVSGKVRLSESTREGGLCRFTIPFVQAVDQVLPTTERNTAELVEKSADDAGDEAAKAAASKLTASKLAALIAAMTARIQAIIAKIDAIRAMLSPPLIPPLVTNLIKMARNLSLAISGLIRAPLALVAEVRGFIGSLGSITAYPRAAIDAYRGLFDFGNDSAIIAPSTPTRALEAANTAAFNKLVQQTAVIEACRLASRVDFVNYQDAVTLRDELSDRLDGLMATADDALYTALMALRTNLNQHINSTATDLARIVSWTPKNTLPALVVAHLIYGDATQADAIISRNRVRHPGFVTGGTPLEVLTP